MLGRGWRWLLVCLVVATPGCCLEWKQGVATEVYWRLDDLEWNIGTERVNVLSELTWDGLQVLGGSVAGVGFLPCDWLIGGSVGGGWIFKGRNQDDDYDADDREARCCYSMSRTRGYVVDGEAGFGHLIILIGRQTVFAIPAIGYAYHRQWLRNFDCDERRIGIWDVEKNAPIRYPEREFVKGDAGFYWTDWHSAWFGLSLIGPLAGRLYTESGIKLHGLYYHGEGDWVLRSDFAGFDHYAFGFGWELDTILRLQLTRCAYLFGIFRVRRFKGNRGREVLQYSDGETVRLTFNSVRWRSLQLGLGVDVLF